MASATEVDITKLHAESEIRRVAISVLRVDRSYQRDPTQRLVDQIAENWDEISSELILVSDRGEREDPAMSGLWIVNGQHRTLGAKKKGETELDARVLDLRDVEDPASVEAAFRLSTNVRMSDKPLERFKAQLRAGNPESRAIVEILSDFNTEINNVPQIEVGINAVAGVERLYRQDEGVLLRAVLQAIKDSFTYVGGKNATVALLSGIAWFIIKHEEEADRDRFIEKMGDIGIKALDRRARTIMSTMGGPTWLNYYRAMVEIYNEKLQAKGRLEWRHGGSASFKGVSTSWGASKLD